MTVHELRAYDYVNRPYAAVRDALVSDPSIFRRATHAAIGRADELHASLRVELGGLEIGKDVEISVHDVDSGEKRTDLELGWKAVTGSALFPSMSATLAIYPLSSGETQLELDGAYTPPLGALGAALDAAVLHRVAEASVRRFVTDVARLLRTELPAR